MRISEWIQANTEMLKKASVPSARLDTELLLSHALEVDRSWLAAHADDNINEALSLRKHTIEEVDALIERRATHEPIAYITGHQEFYGRDFIVTRDTLTPRPESETMITLLLSELQKVTDSQQQLLILDVGTGNGCLLITAALEIQEKLHLTQVQYTGLDVSLPALRTAQKNAHKHNVDVTFKSYDLLSQAPLYETVFDHVYILANLPYVPKDYSINAAAKHEPNIALFGGDDGLDYYKALFDKVTDNNNFTILCESLEFQHKSLSAIARKASFICTASFDLIQCFKR